MFLFCNAKILMSYLKLLSRAVDLVTYQHFAQVILSSNLSYFTLSATRLCLEMLKRMLDFIIIFRVPVEIDTYLTG